MTIEVQAPDGSTVEFPDNMDEASIDRAMRQQFSSAQTPAARVAEDFAALPPKLGDLRQTKEIPEPDSSKQSFGEMLRNPSQRARNTALGTGPGSVEVGGIPVPGVALPAAPALAAAYRALPTEWREKIRTGAVTAGTEGAAGIAKSLGAPEPVVEWLKTVALVRMFGRTSKPPPAPGRPPFFPPHPEKIWPGSSGTP